LNRAAIAVGSNLGDRAAHLAGAVREVAALLDAVRVSRWIETDAVGVGEQPQFLNGAMVGETQLDPRQLLDRLLDIERAAGRVRPYPGAARTLDLDLILYADRIIDEPGLQLPHPRFRDRLFVLEPLAEIAGDWIDPVTGATVSTLLERLRAER
jgi:2-amino-4-hydroxy-6-hydroxymethyldihydropteridine diphosphokinase